MRPTTAWCKSPRMAEVRARGAKQSIGCQRPQPGTWSEARAPVVSREREGGRGGPQDWVGCPGLKAAWIGAAVLPWKVGLQPERWHLFCSADWVLDACRDLRHADCWTRQSSLGKLRTEVWESGGVRARTQQQPRPAVRELSMLARRD